MPASLRCEILSNIHDHVSGAHFGVHKTFDKIKQRYWWKGMYKDVEHWCKSCTECSMRKSPRNSKKAPLLPIPVEGAFDRVAVDVLGPLPPSNKGNRYIVVFSDYLTRWCEAFPVPSVEATVIARLLVDEIISRHGAPRVLLSDRGTNFLFKIVNDVCKFSLPLNSVFVSVSCRCDGSILKSGFLLIFWWHFAFPMFLNEYKFCSSTLGDLV